MTTGTGMAIYESQEQQQRLAAAAQHLRSAINLLDDAEAPDQIAARVDHAACELDDLIASTRVGGPAAEPQDDSSKVRAL